MSEHVERVALTFEVKDVGDATKHCRITVPAYAVERVYQQAVVTLQKKSHVPGFQRGLVPYEYIAHNHAIQLRHHIQDFCLNYFVVPFLYRSIRSHQLLVAGNPSLIDVHLVLGSDAVFTFALSGITNMMVREWKYLPFKAPRRKQYKDLDRQAEQFIKTELELEKTVSSPQIRVGDWVHLQIMLATGDGQPLFAGHTESFWIKIGVDEIDNQLHEPFLNKTLGYTQTIINEHIQNHFCNRSHIPTPFIITIADIIHDTFFCFEQFKKCFRLKSKRDIQQKLIEVFSYQHDISQRRAMAERSLALLLSKNKFEIPPQLFAVQQDLVVEAVRHNPDYHVYRTQKDFQKRIEQLARKQAAEILILDQVSYCENIEPSYADIRSYFNLMKRPRTKEFIYFNPPITKIDGQETLLYQEEIAHLSGREKTLNYIIHHLTRT